MTPEDIIDRVKARFDVLYFDDSDKLETLMADTMGTFEDRAGAVRSFPIAAGVTTAAVPADFLAVATVYGADGAFVDHSLGTGYITISGSPRYPVTVQYLVNFREMGMTADLPAESIGLIAAHFEAKLAVQNARRERNVALAAGLQREITPDESLLARVDAVELAMEENASIIPIAMVV
ncbi:MAG: hypothetical protein ABIL58_23295 [Pseudomonadota bacterium]